MDGLIVIRYDGLPVYACTGRTGADEGPVMERLTKRLMQMKLLLYGDGEKDVDKEKGLVRLVGVACVSWT